MKFDVSQIPALVARLSPPIIESIAIILPIFNCSRLPEGEAIFLEVLQSIETSLDYFREHYPWAARIKTEVAIIDDASTDQTGDLALEFAQAQSHWWYVRHPENVGQGTARNTGAQILEGQALFFCDGDDPYQPEHLFLGFAALNQPLPKTAVGTASPLPNLPQNYPAIVKTGINFSEPIHPDWQQGLENTLCQNRCIRRELHEFIEGFPESEVYRQSYEDAVYDAWACQFGSVVKVPYQTVDYRRYPGNAFDRQLAQFQRPASHLELDTSPEAIALEEARSRIFYDHLKHLHKKYAILKNKQSLKANDLNQNQGQNSPNLSMIEL